MYNWGRVRGNRPTATLGRAVGRGNCYRRDLVGTADSHLGPYAQPYLAFTLNALDVVLKRMYGLHEPASLRTVSTK